jgi:hypothetical protein
MMADELSARGSEQLTVSNTAINLTGVSGFTPRRALIVVTGAPIRWLAGGTTPTATLGIPVDVDGVIDWTQTESGYRQLIANALFIRATGTDATLEIIYFD